MSAEIITEPNLPEAPKKKFIKTDDGFEYDEEIAKTNASELLRQYNSFKYKKEILPLKEANSQLRKESYHNQYLMKILK